jgi:DNA repair exonuclease SbcCD ATPase subunit
MDFYRITKVRLVNFHNFTDETITIRDGGHLFLLGDNGSGKTTVLDAVHFVLTGGRAMEFNAAARVAGARHSGGRTVQGIIMRYNIEANGPLNPNGGITYAALEIAGRHGRPTTAAVGVSASSMDESYESWGVIREGGVDDLPLLVSDAGRKRVATKIELRDALDKKGYYGQIGAYTDELASRFFSERGTYDDVCKFLATGKAYREIAAQTSDYHQLFRRLLQEPPREVFEEVVVRLKSLEESRQDLESLRERLDHVTELATLCDSVAAARIRNIACQWQDHHLAVQEYQVAFDDSNQLCINEVARLQALTEEQARLDNICAATRERLAEIKQRDPQGLVSAEQRAKREKVEAHRLYEKSMRELKECQLRLNERQAALAKARATLVQEVQSRERALLKESRHLPFATTPLAAILEELQKENAAIATLDTMRAAIATLRQQADAETSTLDRNLQTCASELQNLQQQIERLNTTIVARRAQGDTLPLLPDFAQAQAVIGQRMLDAQPLYMGLEPVSGITARELAGLEQIIGEDTLATWVCNAASADELRALIYRDFPGHSLAVVDAETDHAPASHCEWLKRYFDFSKSDPAAIMVLQHQLLAKHGPKAQKFLDHQVLHFRLREQILSTAQPRLIGTEQRRRELERELRELEKELNALERQHKKTDATHGDLQERLRVVNAFKQFLTITEHTVSQLRDALVEQRSAFDNATTAHEAAHNNCVEREEEYQRKTDQHTDLQVALKKAGLEGVEARADEIERKLRAYESEKSKIEREVGRVEKIVDDLKECCAVATADMAREHAARDAAQKLLLSLVIPTEAIDQFVAQRCGAVADNRDALRAAAEEARINDAQLAERIHNRIIQPESSVFGFVYETGANTLIDRRGRAISDVLAGVAHDLREQEELINDSTIKLFRQIIMDELVSQLQMHVRRLREMSRRINQLLKERAFGSNRYSFSITEVDTYKRFHDLVMGYRSFDPEKTAEELRSFIEDHAREIKSTEINEIPALLDYRNWFRYELRVATTDANGVVMDRRLKSLGSGGEQAVPNYLLILTIAHFLYDKEKIRLPVLIFDEAFYGIDAGRRDQILAFASDLELQLFIASPDQDGVKKEIPLSTSVLVVKDASYNVHLYAYDWNAAPRQSELLEG